MAEGKKDNTLTMVLALGGLFLGGYALVQYLKPTGQEYRHEIPPGGRLPGGYVNTSNAPQWAVWTNFGLQVANQLGNILAQIPWSSLPGGSANPTTEGIPWGDITPDELNDYLEYNY